MTMTVRISHWMLAAAASASLMGSRAEAPPTPALPPFAEVFSLLQSHLADSSEAELNRAAVAGLLQQLRSRVTLVTNASAPGESKTELLTRTNVLENAYGYLRVGNVAPGLSNELVLVYEQWRASHRLKGLIFDLRYASGQDYAAAAAAADLFFNTEQPLLQWGQSTVRSTAKNQAIDLPLVLLVNGETTGAAEALAATLRKRDGALLLGSPTAGQAYLFQDFPLSNGQALRVATDSVVAGDGEKLSDTGLTPDILIAVKPEDEKTYFEDPYKVLPRPFAQSTRASQDPLLASTNRFRRPRPNEAELVRKQLGLEDAPFNPHATLVVSPVISDPALSRALDLLKGLALAVQRR